MGGIGSALEAGLRKLRKEGNGNLFLHKVMLDDSKLIDINDLGDAHSWEKSWEYLNNKNKLGCAGWRYTNNFEPDPKKSICIFDLIVIKQIVSCDILCLDEAEDKLISYEIDNHWPDYIL